MPWMPVVPVMSWHEAAAKSAAAKTAKPQAERAAVRLKTSEGIRVGLRTV